MTSWQRTFATASGEKPVLWLAATAVPIAGCHASSVPPAASTSCRTWHANVSQQSACIAQTTSLVDMVWLTKCLHSAVRPSARALQH